MCQEPGAAGTWARFDIIDGAVLLTYAGAKSSACKERTRPTNSGTDGWREECRCVLGGFGPRGDLRDRRSISRCDRSIFQGLPWTRRAVCGADWLTRRSDRSQRFLFEWDRWRFRLRWFAQLCAWLGLGMPVVAGYVAMAAANPSPSWASRSRTD